MPSVRETILVEISDRLAAIAASLSYSFERNRLAEIEDAEMPALVLYDGGFQAEDGDTGGDGRTLAVQVLAVVTGETGAALGAKASEVASAVETALVSSADERLGDLAGVQFVRVVEMDEPIFGADQDAGFYASFNINFEIRFAVQWGDPDTAA